MIVVGRKGTAGSVYWSDLPGWPIDTAYWVKLRPKGADLAFVYLLLQHLDLPAISAQTGVPGLNRDRAYELSVDLPPLDEQRRIVDLIDSVDAAAGEALTLVASAREAIARLSTALIDGCTNTVPLGDLLLDIDGGRSPVTDGRAPAPGEPSVLKLSALRPGRFEISERKALIPGTAMPERAIAQDGDVLITRSNTASTVGYACQVEQADGLTYLSDLTLRLHPVADRLDPAYLVEALCSQGMRSQIEGSARGTSGSMRKISRELIRGYMIPVPSMDRQRRVAGDLKAVRILGDQAQEELRALRQLRSALLEGLLSGDHEIPASYDDLLAAV